MRQVVDHARRNGLKTGVARNGQENGRKAAYIRAGTDDEIGSVSSTQWM